MNANTSTTLKDPPPHSLINVGEHLYGFQITEAICLDEHTSQYLARSKESTYNQVPREVVIRLANLPHRQGSRSLLEREIDERVCFVCFVSLLIRRKDGGLS